ncbi:hypothetical protein C8J57DRAFT_1358626 [Mycena rebaudengoi]|nr:hypothetical protein C8J57DRAFT_1358626 [Mycena rebaudengoi]
MPSAANAITLEPRLPPELEREIFTRAAISHPETIPVLLPVARRVLIWIEPLLYRVARVSVNWNRDTFPGAPFTSATLKAKPPSFFHTAIRHVLVDEPPERLPPGFVDILANCTQIVSFAALRNVTPPWLLPILERVKPQRLTISLSRLFQGRTSDLANPLFTSLTHLDLFTDFRTMDGDVHCDFSLLPEIAAHRIQTILADCRNLRVLADLFPPHRRAAALAVASNPPPTDRRFVVVPWKNHWADWGLGTRGGADFWARADDFIARKMRGEIAGQLLYLPYAICGKRSST